MANTISFRMSHIQNPRICQTLHQRPWMLSSPSALKISCCMGRETRKPLWRERVLSSETLQAVYCLKLVRSPEKLQEVVSSKISRLLKADLVETLIELQRQDELEFSLKVLDVVKNEEWYIPDTSLFSNMIMILGKNKQIEIAEKLFSKMIVEDGLKPDTRVYTEMIGAYLRAEMVAKAMDLYGQMKESGCHPDKLTFTILISNLEAFGEDEFIASVKSDCENYMEYPNKLLEEIYMRIPKRRSLDLV